MIDKALSTAQTSLLDAKERANRLAREIVTATSDQGGRLDATPGTDVAAFGQFTSLLSGVPEDTSAAQAPDAGTGRPLSSPLPLSDGDFVRSVVDLKAAEQAFASNANLLSRLDEMADTTLDALDTED